MSTFLHCKTTILDTPPLRGFKWFCSSKILFCPVLCNQTWAQKKTKMKCQIKGFIKINSPLFKAINFHAFNFETINFQTFNFENLKINLHFLRFDLLVQSFIVLCFPIFGDVGRGKATHYPSCLKISTIEIKIKQNENEKMVTLVEEKQPITQGIGFLFPLWSSLIETWKGKGKIFSLL